MRGKTYAIMRPSAADGQKLLTLLAVAMADPDGEEIPESVRESIAEQASDDAVARLALGRAFDEMIADGLSGPEIQAATSAAVICWTASREAAEAFWRSGGELPGQSPTAPQQTATPTLTASASTTRTSVSRKRTTARRTAQSAGSSKGSHSRNSGSGTPT